MNQKNVSRRRAVRALAALLLALLVSVPVQAEAACRTDAVCGTDVTCGPNIVCGTDALWQFRRFTGCEGAAPWRVWLRLPEGWDTASHRDGAHPF